MLKKCFSLCLLLISFNLAAENSTTQLSLEAFLDNTKSLSARFEQTLVDKFGFLLQESSGSLSMQRPGKFRWDYRLPYPQNIISNGEKIWMYDSELEQVNVRPYGQVLASSPVNLLDKNQKLDIEFIVEDMPKNEGQHWLRLTPKDTQSDFKEMQIGLKAGVIKTMRFIDNFEQQTDINFEQLVANPSFKHLFLNLPPPEGRMSSVIFKAHYA